VRPLGAVFFGHLGDRFGRRGALVASISLMCAAAGLIGVLPTYAQIGVFAPILLVILRMLQGFSAGGEIGGAASYIREWASPERRPLYVSFIPGVAVFGKATAAGVAAVIATAVPDATMEAWAWRIPFLIAIPLGILCLVLRLKVEDSPEFSALQNRDKTQDRPFTAMIRGHRGALAKVIAIATVQSIGTYVGTVFVASYLSSVLGFSKSNAAVTVLIATVIAAFLILGCGWLGMKVGSRKLLVISYLTYMAITIPAFLLMGMDSLGWAVFGLSVSMVPYAINQAGTYSILPEFFPTEVRNTGVSFGHSTGAVIGGGGGPYAATWLINATDNVMVPAYVLVGFATFGLLMVLIGVRRTPEGTSYLYQ
jgi:MFS transporter, MHS family, proline/betaine transporter